MQLVLGREVPVAQSIRLRLLGLSMLPRVAAGPGLWIPRCRSIHTFGMRFEIDLVFVDHEISPLRSVTRVGPCRLVSCARAYGVLELPALPR